MDSIGRILEFWFIEVPKMFVEFLVLLVALYFSFFFITVPMTFFIIFFFCGGK
jgi:hypothetical protein